MKENEDFNGGEKIKARKTESLFSRTFQRRLGRREISSVRFFIARPITTLGIGQKKPVERYTGNRTNFSGLRHFR
jgi:hypothetical protein